MIYISITFLVIGIGCMSIGIVWMIVRDDPRDKSRKGETADYLLFNGFFTIVADILLAFQRCIKKPSVENAPELLTFLGAGLLLTAKLMS